jgi:hypothetical protein
VRERARARESERARQPRTLKVSKVASSLVSKLVEFSELPTVATRNVCKPFSSFLGL